MSKQAPRSAERQVLADEIARLVEARLAVTALEDAIASTRTKARHARDAVSAADAAAADAKGAVAAHALAAALGDAGAPPMSPGEARAAAQAARDELSSLEETLEGLEALTKSRESSASLRLNDVRGRLADVIRTDPGVRRMLSAFEVVRQAYFEQRAVLEFLSARKMLPPGLSLNEPINPAGAAPWRDAIANLERDADAALPS